MRKILLSVVLVMGILKSFSQTIDAAAAHRIGDYGKLWTVLNLFHPTMAYGKINGDSLFVDNIGDLLKDPTAANFKEAVQKMLNRLGDPYTTLKNAPETNNDSVALPMRTLLRWLPDSVALLHFDEDFMSHSNSNAAITPLTKMMDSIKNATGVVIDLRNEKATEGMSSYYEAEFVKRLAGYLTNRTISAPGRRTRIHYGHESQTFDMSQYYYQGWVSTAGALIQAKPKALHKPVCLVINKNNENLGSIVTALQNAGAVRVVAHGVLKKFDPVSSYEMQLADSVTVAVRTGEVVYTDGSNFFSPDAQIAQTEMHDDIIINTAAQLLKSTGKREQNTVAKEESMPLNPVVSGYDSLAYPSAPLRLLGLMRYWTAINYFCPDNDRITKNWDSVLYEYVPKFLAAKDSFEYNYVAARLIKEINDSHGFFGSKVLLPTMANVPPVQLKYVQGKTIIYQLFNDSLKNKIAIGDEVISVNGASIKTIRDSIAQYIGASNESALQRDVNMRVLAGRVNTAVKVTFKHNGRPFTLTLPRSADTYDIGYRSEKPGAVWKKLNPKLGYVDLGRLEVEQTDSMFTDFKNTDAIIIDDRSYPRGTAWTIINYLTTHDFGSPKFTTIIAESPEPLIQTRQNFQETFHITPKPQYNGEIIMLVNETTQSQAEYTCMMFQGASKAVTIIGSQTAGADGDVTGIAFPGGIRTAFSGHGVHYPDGRPTQGIGIVPDIKIKPTVAGIKAGRDEVLERAVQFAKTGK